MTFLLKCLENIIIITIMDELTRRLSNTFSELVLIILFSLSSCIHGDVLATINVIQSEDAIDQNKFIIIIFEKLKYIQIH